MPVREINYPNTGGPSKEVHGEPGVNPRVETGPVRFGGDWTGLFIRGDEAFGLAIDIAQIREWYAKLPEDVRKASGLGMAIRSLAGYETLIRDEVIEK